MKQLVLLGLALLAAGCATPGIDYSARIVPENTAVVETRTVDVGRFAGPAGGWFEGQFEAMLAEAYFDGAPWFRFARYTDGSVPAGERAGIYEGDIDVSSYNADEFTRTVSKCVEWDGLFDCEHREDVDEICLREQVNVRVTPRLVEYGSGAVLFSQSYFGSASSEQCSEVYRRGRKGRHHGSYGYGSAYGVSPPAGLVEEALGETLASIRADVAPMNARVRATFVTEPSDPAVAADPLFGAGIDASKNSPEAACLTWASLAERYPASPAIIHNMGACAEASGDYLSAQSLYGEAADLSARYSADGSIASDYAEALARLASRRRGLAVLDRLLSGPPATAAASEAGELGS